VKERAHAEVSVRALRAKEFFPFPGSSGEDERGDHYADRVFQRIVIVLRNGSDAQRTAFGSDNLVDDLRISS
jgi:hypothetical protein